MSDGSSLLGLESISKKYPGCLANDDVSLSIEADAMTTEQAIRNGELHPFKGPVNNQSGETMVAEGENASDEMLLGMDWYVEGVDGKLPK